MTRTDGSVATEVQLRNFEDLLLEEHLVTEKQLERARRISRRMQSPKPIGEVLIELGQLSRSEYERIVRLYRSQLSISQILKQNGALDDAGLAAYQQTKAENPDVPDRQALVVAGIVSEEDYLRAVSVKHDVPFVEPDIGLVATSIVSKASMAYLRRNRILPCRISDGHLTVLMADPLDTGLILELEGIYHTIVTPCGAVSTKILQALDTLQRLQETEDGDITTALQYHEIQEPPEDDAEGEGAIRIVDYLLFQAIKAGASDLHIEPLRKKLRVRIRVDGVLRQLTDLPADFAPRVVSRVKVLSDMDIAERRLHQDGRFLVKAEGKDIDIRVSAYAGMFGETLVLRLLDRDHGLVPVDALGFEPKILSMLKEVVLRSSSGLVLVTGPTGSGKTTTMYSFVDYVNDDTLKVITCENPVEYTIDGTTQCSVNEKTGPTFPDSLRSIVRQDPDIIVVGEIRDAVTANLAVEAALTGHKVFSTFHTEDAVTAVLRLLEMGVEPFLVSSTLSCVVAQRLVRRVCKSCSAPAEAARKDLRFLGLSRENIQDLPILEGAGCPDCNNIGYRGRLGIHEVMLLDDAFRDAILSRATSMELRAHARRLHGFLTLQEDGLLKVLSGTTTLSEIANTAPRDPGMRPLPVLREAAAMRRFR